MGEAAEAAGVEERWLSSPTTFCRDVLRERDGSVFEPWPRQEQILEDVPTSRRVSVRSGHKVGKSRTAAALALWFWTMFSDARVVLTAPTFRQVDEVLWREVQYLHRHAAYPLGGAPMKTPTAGLEYDGRQIFGLSTDTPERFSGISGPNVLYIVDEASGVSEEIFEAIEGNRAGGAWLVMFSNPTQLVGTFYESHTLASNAWSCHAISSEEAAMYQERVRRVPGLATAEWVEERAREWGVDSPQYQVRVEGNFPDEGPTQVVPLLLVTDALTAWATWPDDVARPGLQRLEVGVDVARFGDDKSCFIGRREQHVYHPHDVGGLDVVQVAQEAMRYTDRLLLAGEMRVSNTQRPRLKVDTVGIGSGVADYLRHHNGERVEVVDVNASASPKDKTKYVSLRDELWFGVRMFLQAGGTLPDHKKLRADLMAPGYKIDAANRYKVQSKDEIKKVLKRSPDYADALALAVYEPAGYRATVGRVRGI